MAGGGSNIKELRYQVMLALYLPILLYSFSTFDLEEKSVAAEKVTPILVGGEQNVVLGQDYTANAYLKASQLAKGGEITLSTDDEKVTVDGNEDIRIATADLLSEDEEEKEIDYSITMEYDQLEGSATETLNGSFTVRRPELVATSVATSSLYSRTKNEIRIDVPGLENREIDLESSAGGQTSGRQLTLSPTSEEVTVSAFLPKEDGDRVLLGQMDFAVIDPPRPQLTVQDAQGQRLSSGDNIPRARPGLTFKVEPDAEFQQSYPEDANYRAGQAEVSIRQGLRASEEIGTFELGPEGNLEAELIRALDQVGAQPKDRLIIQLRNVVRINHNGQQIPVDLDESSLSYSFTLS